MKSRRADKGSIQRRVVVFSLNNLFMAMKVMPDPQALQIILMMLGFFFFLNLILSKILLVIGERWGRGPERPDQA